MVPQEKMWRIDSCCHPPRCQPWSQLLEMAQMLLQSHSSQLPQQEQVEGANSRRSWQCRLKLLLEFVSCLLWKNKGPYFLDMHTSLVWLQGNRQQHSRRTAVRPEHSDLQICWKIEGFGCSQNQQPKEYLGRNRMLFGLVDLTPPSNCRFESKRKLVVPKYQRPQYHCYLAFPEGTTALCCWPDRIHRGRCFSPTPCSLVLICKEWVLDIKVGKNLPYIEELVVPM